jgi:ribonuclease HII
MTPEYRIGIDENGLGALLGPMVVTAVSAHVDERGQRLLARRLPLRLRRDLDDSKRLVSHANLALAEAWARALTGGVQTPEELFRAVCLEDQATLTEPCPRHVRAQCWTPTNAGFIADPELVTRVRGHLGFLEQRGVRIAGARCSVLCTKVLNGHRRAGGNRFVSDLHAMERLTLEFRQRSGQDVTAICGKVGGIADYSKFFGPLSGWLHAVIEVGRKRSAYRFPGVGELHFVRDADAKDPLVMLASLLGKYVRELLMGKIANYYEPGAEEPPSGYHDPITKRFILRTESLRKNRRIPRSCFERDGANAPVSLA